MSTSAGIDRVLIEEVKCELDPLLDSAVGSVSGSASSVTALMVACDKGQLSCLQYLAQRYSYSCNGNGNVVNDADIYSETLDCERYDNEGQKCIKTLLTNLLIPPHQDLV